MGRREDVSGVLASYSVLKTGKDEREQKRPSLHDGSGGVTLKLDPPSFSIIGGEGDFL